MLAHRLQKRGETGVLPPGFVADLEDEQDLEDLRRRLSQSEEREPPSADHLVWIAKGSNANRGESLFLARSANEVVDALRPAALEASIPEWVVQRYVSPPLLLGSRKFHIRAHFLVSGCPNCGTTRAWFHERNHVLLLATNEYSASSQDRLVHLTNHCLQVSLPGYDESRQIMALEELDSATKRPGLAAHVQAKMESAIKKALMAAASAPVGFAPLPQCFELFGADFVLEGAADGEMPKVWLLEVNAGPDLAVFGNRLRGQCVELAADVMRIAVEPFLDCVEWPSKFRDPANCPCGSIATNTGFADCMWSIAPRSASAMMELKSFKRRLSIAGRWVKSLHESSGVAVRGAQGVVG